MKNFQYAHPRTEAEAVDLLTESGISTAVLAGGTDLVGLMKGSVVSPDRVVNIGDVESFRYIDKDTTGSLWIGAAVHLDEFLDSAIANPYPAVKQVIQNISSVQLQSQGTLVGELLRRPTCWYFRNGHDVLADGGRVVEEGDNRHHAILGNRGAAKFVSASRLAPALISLGAQVRVVSADGEETIKLHDLYQIPERSGDSELTLRSGELVTHVIIPPVQNRLSAAYEVRQGVGPDQPLAAAAVCMDVQRGAVREAQVVMGQVAPIPWVADEAARSLVGRPISQELADIAGVEAVAGCRALSHNQYKIELAKVAVQRAILKAVGLETGGFCDVV